MDTKINNLLQQIYEAHVPGTNLIAWTPGKGNTRIHSDLGSFDQARAALERTIQAQTSMHLCVGVTSLPPIKQAVEGGGEKLRWRTVERLDRGAWGVVLDIDIDATKPSSHHASMEEVSAAISRFLQTAQIPTPWLVLSGGGVHLYWVFNRRITLAEHEYYICSLLTLANKAGLKVERKMSPTATFRLPGSVNEKYPSTYASVAYEAESSTDADQFKTQLEQAIEVNGLVTPTMKNPAIRVAGLDALADGFTTSYKTEKEADSTTIEQNCPQLQFIAGMGGAVPEPFWYAAIGIAAFCKDSKDAANRWSHNHPTYDETETLDKLLHWEQDATGPTTCGHMCQQSQYPELCDACPSQNTITSPIQLGKPGSLFSVPASPEQEGNPAPVALPMPKGFFNKDGGLFRTIPNDAGGVATSAICYAEVYPKAISELDGDSYVIFDAVIQGRKRVVEIPTGVLHEPKDLRRLFGQRGVILTNIGAEHIKSFAVQAANVLVRHTDVRPALKQFGWVDKRAGFVIGERLFGSANAPLSREAEDFANQFYGQHGVYEEWRRAADAYDGRENLLPHQFALMAGLGAPLLCFTSLHGALLNIYGRSGTGKSTLLQVVASAYGAAKENMLLDRDTLRAKYSTMGLVNNLPVCYDELTVTDVNTVRNLAYSVSQGRDHMKKVGAAHRLNTPTTWNTLVLATSNTSVRSAIADTSSNVDGELARVIEIYSPPPTRGAKIHIDATHSGIQQNYGLFGDLFIPKVLAETSSIQQRVLEKIAALGKDLPPNTRFMVATAAIALTTAELVSQWGLIKVDVEALTSWALGWVRDATSSGAQFLPSEEQIRTGLMSLQGLDIAYIRNNAVSQMRQFERIDRAYNMDEGWIAVTSPVIKRYAKFNNITTVDLLARMKDLGMIIGDVKYRSRKLVPADCELAHLQLPQSCIKIRAPKHTVQVNSNNVIPIVQ